MVGTVDGVGVTSSGHTFLPLLVDGDGNIGTATTTDTNNNQKIQDDLPWGLRFILHNHHNHPPELKTLLLEAKPHRSKWYDPLKPGQGELYDGLERVLSELKAFTPHSVPFLHRVSKKDVPDYHLIIRQPMDFGTMAKRLRAHEYRSKSDFCRDLQLIYDNCMPYNQQEESPLRAAVRLLREKWQLLLNKVPDITVGGGDVSTAASSDAVDAMLEEDLRVVLSDSDSDTVDEPLIDQSPIMSLKWPARSPQLMNAFRKSHQSQQRDIDAADWALMCNAFPDTWTVDCRTRHTCNNDFNRLGVESLLECVRLHSGIGLLSGDALLGCNRVETAMASRRVSLKIAGLIVAASGCDGTLILYNKY